MTESQSGPALDALPAGHAEDSDALPPPSAAPEPADSGRGSRRRSQWFSVPADGSGGGPDSGPSGPRRLQKKSALVLGATGVLVIGVAAVVAAATLSGGGATKIATAASSSTAAPGTPNSGKLVPIKASASAAKAKKKAAGKPSSSPPAVVSSAPAEAAPKPKTSTAAASKPTSTSASNSSVAGTSSGVSGPEPVSFWPLNDDDLAKTAADVMGEHTATGVNVNWCGTGGGNCATFNGSSSDFATSGPVLDTAPGSSFTVSANVYMTAINTADSGFETILSQDGTYDSGFYLQYSGSDKKWAFARVGGDTDASPGGVRALSTSAPALYTWTHLVGVFDASDDQLRLYVNGVLEGTATDSSPFAATGDLVIGRGQFNGAATDWFNGAANQIKVFDQALTAAQAGKI